MPDKILFVCIGNSCRSQIAEAFTRIMHPDRFEAYSAGINPSALDPLTVEVMQEIGIDLAGAVAKTIESLGDTSFDYVVTVCGKGADKCPFIPAAKGRYDCSFPDPPHLTAEIKAKEEKLAVYRSVRDEIKSFITTLPAQLERSVGVSQE